ncbi:hypothetical protein TGDOM2_260205A, partial [Toxoplasma gondii GAB2-2007-GAL-DOM2]
MRQGNTH